MQIYLRKWTTFQMLLLRLASPGDEGSKRKIEDRINVAVLVAQPTTAPLTASMEHGLEAQTAPISDIA
ncbi:MAG: hypothetical protein M1830_008337, partial [Pleopsidium flavum]